MTKEKIKTLKQETAELLEKFEQARDNDTNLIMLYLFEKGLLSKDIVTSNDVIDISGDLPALMSLGRWRAKYQNDFHKFLSDNVTMAAKEQLNSDWKEVLRRDN